MDFVFIFPFAIQHICRNAQASNILVQYSEDNSVAISTVNVPATCERIPESYDYVG